MHAFTGCIAILSGALLPSGTVFAQIELPPGAQPSIPRVETPRLPTQQESVFEIPPVFDRPLGVDEGARIFVRSFRLVGIVDDPEAGISRAEVEALAQARFDELMALLEKLRIERQQQENVDEYGFTPEEQQRILEFMQGVVSELSPDRQQQEYQRFIDQLRVEKLQRDQGMTLGQLQQLADEVTRYYRARGFFLARAVIPAQEVVNGVVTVRVLEGRLGEARVEGNERYSSRIIETPFDDMRGKLITVEAVENALLTLKSYPGLSAFGVFRPGEDIGTADIVINVQRENPFNLILTADNHGTRFTGENRALADFTWNNPLGGADRLGMTILQTFQPDNAVYGSLRYDRALPDPSYRAGVELSRNTFDVSNLSGANVGAEVGGVAEIGKLKLEKYFQRTRQNSVWGTLDLSRKRADTESGALLVNRDDLAVFGAELAFERIDGETASIHSGFVRLDIGLDGMLGTADAESLPVDTLPVPAPSRVVTRPDRTFAYGTSDFTKLTLNYSRLKSLPASQTVLFRFNGQYSRDLLTSLEQFVIGGPNSVRAIPVSQFLADTGYLASLEYTVRAPFFADKPAFAGRTWGEVIGITLFTDHAVGLINQPLPTQQRRTSVGGSGLGINFGIPGMFDLNLQAAKLKGGPRPGRGAFDVTAIEDDMQYWADFTWFF